MSFELGRTERILRDYAVTATVNGEAVVLTSVDVALLPANTKPDGDTTWEPKAVGTVPAVDPSDPDVPGISILWTGGDAAEHVSSVVVPPGSWDAFLQVTDDPEIDYALIERIDCV
jgi:hypothetical protein